MGQLEPETQAVREFYAALNRGDVPAALNAFDAQIEVIEPPEFPMAGTYHGLAAVKEHFTKARATWAEGSCEPQRFIAASDKVIAIVEVRVRLKTEKEWRQGRLADVFTFRKGKVTQFRNFAEEKQALEFAGAK